MCALFKLTYKILPFKQTARRLQEAIPTSTVISPKNIHGAVNYSSDLRQFCKDFSEEIQTKKTGSQKATKYKYQDSNSNYYT